MSAGTRTAAGRGILLLLLAAVGLLAFYPRVVARGFTVVAGLPYDVRHSAFVLEWGRLCLVGDPLCRDLWSPPIFHPTSESLTLSEPLLGLQPLYLAWRASGLGTAPAQLLTQATLLVAIFLVAYLLFRRSAELPAHAAALGAYVAAFGAPRSAQIDHLLLFGQAPSLAAVAALLVALQETTPNRGRAAVLAAWLLAAAQLWSGIYLSWVTALLAALTLLLSLPFAEARRAWARTLRRDLPAWIAGPILAGLLTAPMLAAFERRLETHSGERPEAIHELQPTLTSWLDPGVDHLLWGKLSRGLGIAPQSYAWEHALGLGLVTALLVAVGVVSAWRRPPLRPPLLAALVAVLLTLRWPGGGSAWGAAVEWLPGAPAIRAIGRLGVVLLPLAGLAVAFAFAAIARRRWSRLTVALLALMVLIEPVRRHGVFSPRPHERHVEAIARAVRAGDCASFLVSPWSTSRRRPGLATQLDAMYAALATGVPTLNGYSSYGPVGWNLDLPAPGRPGDREALVATACSWAESHRLDLGSVCWIRFDLEGPRRPNIERLTLAAACPGYESPGTLPQ